MASFSMLCALFPHFIIIEVFLFIFRIAIRKTERVLIDIKVFINFLNKVDDSMNSSLI